MASSDSSLRGSLVGIFTRADHPPGWGYPPRQDEPGGRAHGYVVLYVECHGQEELERVAAVLASGFDGLPVPQYSDGALSPNGHPWFGGRFECVGKAPAIDVGKYRFQCRGDNRMVAFYTAREVLDPMADSSADVPTVPDQGHHPQPPLPASPDRTVETLGAGAPTGLYFSERKLWESCPEAHDVLARLARYRQALKVLVEEPETTP